MGYSCNNSCVYCHSAPFNGRPDLTTDEIRDRVELARERGAEMIVFSGGEPTIRRDIAELARLVRDRGLGFGLITNGRRFVYPRFGEELASLGLGYVYVSFHAPTRRAHALSARTDSFQQTLAAISNLVKLDAEVTVNTVVTRLNIGGLRRVVDLLGALRPAAIKLSAVEPKGNALDDVSLCPPLPAAAAAIADAVRYGRSRYAGIAFGCEGLTPCLLEDFDSLNDDLFTNGFVLYQEAWERSLSAPDYANRAKAASCAGCEDAERCPGVFAGYLAMRPPPLLRPNAAAVRRAP